MAVSALRPFNRSRNQPLVVDKLQSASAQRFASIKISVANKSECFAPVAPVVDALSLLPHDATIERAIRGTYGRDNKRDYSKILAPVVPNQ